MHSKVYILFFKGLLAHDRSVLGERHDEDVPGLEVSVDHAAAVEEVEAHGDVPADADPVLGGEGALLLAEGAVETPEDHELCDDAQLLGGVHNADELHNVRTTKL